MTGKQTKLTQGNGWLIQDTVVLTVMVALCSMLIGLATI